MLAYYKEWHESGLGKKAYCQQKGLTASTFFYWIKKLELQKESFPPLPSAAGFTELDFSLQADTPSLVLEIEYASGARLKFYRQVEASFLKSLL